MTPKEYDALVRQLSPKSPIWKDTALAFLIGGAICVLGQLLMTLYGGLDEKLCAAAVSGGLALLFGADVLPVTLWECGAGAGIYALLPKKILPGLYAAGKRAENTPEPTAAPYARPAAALRALYDSFFRGQQPRPPENPAVIFDRAAQEVCSGCVLRTDCWQSRYSDTYSAFNDACPELMKRPPQKAAHRATGSVDQRQKYHRLRSCQVSQ